MYSDAEAHLANLQHCSSDGLRHAYLTILIAATAAGFSVTARTVGAIHEMRIRDSAGRQFFALDIDDTMRFGLRAPALAAQPWLAGEAMVRFGDWVKASGDEVAIQLRSADCGERIAEWLFGVGPAARLASRPATRTELSPEYAERISA